MWVICLADFSHEMSYFLWKKKNNKKTNVFNDKTNRTAYVPSEDSDKPEHLPSLISQYEESLGP